VRLLGTGGQGNAFLYQNPETGMKVAVKIFKDMHGGQLAANREILHMQKLQQWRLKHSVAYYKDGFHANRSYLVLEYMEYSIEEYLAKFRVGNQIDMKKYIQVADQMIDCLKELHGVGLVHSDVKPENFRVSDKGIVKILDFGITGEYIINGKHKMPGQYGFQGTPKFGSVRSLGGANLARRDDFECLGYTLMDLYDLEFCPWKQFDNIRDAMNKKEDFIKNFMASNGRDVPFGYRGLHKFIKRAYDMDFSAAPDYNGFKNDIRQMDPDYFFNRLQEIMIVELVEESAD
jgi:serine/threonine protein kinase